MVVAGAELFTGNNLLVMAWAAGRITGWELLRNRALVLLGNATGAVGLALLVVLAGQASLNDGEVGRHAVRLAALKVTLPCW
ncbi:hypothetical protein KH5H1_56190 [Corallococcus caeni]|nr:hypothetical protein KH5H1_56190 [Corallococcus sp. KH5-1]